MEEINDTELEELEIIEQEIEDVSSITSYITNSTQMYLHQIGQIPLLTPAKEIELAQKIKQGDEHALNELVEANLRLVVKTAIHYHSKRLDFMDLIQEGNLGLIEAAKNFDPDKGFKFSTYAIWWIKKYISKALIEQGQDMRLPANLYALELKMREASIIFCQKNGYEPTDEQLSEILKVDITQINKVRAARQEVVSLNISIGDDNDTLEDLIADDSLSDFNSNLFNEFNSDTIDIVLDTLEPREKEIIERRFGLHNFEPMTLENIGQELKLSKERVRQLESKAMRKLRHPSRTALLHQIK